MAEDLQQTQINYSQLILDYFAGVIARANERNKQYAKASATVEDTNTVILDEPLPSENYTTLSEYIAPRLNSFISSLWQTASDAASEPIPFNSEGTLSDYTSFGVEQDDPTGPTSSLSDVVAPYVKLGISAASSVRDFAKEATNTYAIQAQKLPSIFYEGFITNPVSVGSSIYNSIANRNLLNNIDGVTGANTAATPVSNYDVDPYIGTHLSLVDNTAFNAYADNLFINTELNTFNNVFNDDLAGFTSFGVENDAELDFTTINNIKSFIKKGINEPFPFTNGLAGYTSFGVENDTELDFTNINNIKSFIKKGINEPFPFDNGLSEYTSYGVEQDDKPIVESSDEIDGVTEADIKINRSGIEYVSDLSDSTAYVNDIASKKAALTPINNSDYTNLPSYLVVNNKKDNISVIQEKIDDAFTSAINKHNAKFKTQTDINLNGYASIYIPTGKISQINGEGGTSEATPESEISVNESEEVIENVTKKAVKRKVPVKPPESPATSDAVVETAVKTSKPSSSTSSKQAKKEQNTAAVNDKAEDNASQLFVTNDFDAAKSVEISQLYDEALTEVRQNETPEQRKARLLQESKDRSDARRRKALTRRLLYGYNPGEWSLFDENKRQAIRIWAYRHGVKIINDRLKDVELFDATTQGTEYALRDELDDLYRNLVSDPSHDNKQSFDSKLGLYSHKDLASYTDNNDAENEATKQATDRFNAANPYRNHVYAPTNFQNNSYSGCDITPSITIGAKTLVLGNIQAFSYSVHRDVTPVRTLGRAYPKTFVSATRSIAGSLVFNVFDTHVLAEVKDAILTEVEANGTQSSPLTDQIPPFDVTVMYSNEYGAASYMRIYGVQIVDEGQTHSINDIYTENVMQWVARDIDLMTSVDSEWTPQKLANSAGFISTPGANLHAMVNQLEKKAFLIQRELGGANAPGKTTRFDDLANPIGDETVAKKVNDLKKTYEEAEEDGLFADTAEMINAGYGPSYKTNLARSIVNQTQKHGDLVIELASIRKKIAELKDNAKHYVRYESDAINSSSNNIARSRYSQHNGPYSMMRSIKDTQKV